MNRLLILSIFFSFLASQAEALGLPRDLLAAVGSYKDVTPVDGRFTYCTDLKLSLSIKGDTVRLDVKKNELEFFDTYPGINTGRYIETISVNGIFSRDIFVFEGRKLKVKNLSFIFFPIGPYKETAVVVEILNDNSIIYNYGGRNVFFCKMARAN